MNTQTDQDTSCFRCSFFVLFWLFWLFFCCCCFFLCQINSSRVFNNSEAVFELEITSLIFSVSSHHQGRTDGPSLLKWHFSAHIIQTLPLNHIPFWDTFNRFSPRRALRCSQSCCSPSTDLCPLHCEVHAYSQMTPTRHKPDLSTGLKHVNPVYRADLPLHQLLFTLQWSNKLNQKFLFNFAEQLKGSGTGRNPCRILQLIATPH